MIKKALYTLGAFAFPLVTFAATLNNFGDVGTFVINTINNILVPVLFAVAFIVFIFGAFQAFILKGGENAAEKGKNLMLYGIIGFVVMLSVWGLVNLVVNTFPTNNALPNTPKANF